MGFNSGFKGLKKYTRESGLLFKRKSLKKIPFIRNTKLKSNMLYVCNFQWEVEFSKLGTHLVCLYILFYACRIQFRTSKGQHVTHHTFFFPGNLKDLVLILCTRRLNTKKILRSILPVYLCVMCGSQNKQKLLPYTTTGLYNSGRVLCEVRGASSNIFLVKSYTLNGFQFTEARLCPSTPFTDWFL